MSQMRKSFCLQSGSIGEGQDPKKLFTCIGEGKHSRLVQYYLVTYQEVNLLSVAYQHQSDILCNMYQHKSDNSDKHLKNMTQKCSATFLENWTTSIFVLTTN